MPKVTSQREARLMGAVIAGKARKAKGLAKAEAKERTRGVEVSKLPERAIREGFRKRARRSRARKAAKGNPRRY